jgi:hypothetical protein
LNIIIVDESRIESTFQLIIQIFRKTTSGINFSVFLGISNIHVHIHSNWCGKILFFRWVLKVTAFSRVIAKGQQIEPLPNLIFLHIGWSKVMRPHDNLSAYPSK